MINEELHVVPRDDSEKHHAQPDCWCQPDLSVRDDAVLWMHHAESMLCVPENQVALRTWRKREL